MVQKGSHEEPRAQVLKYLQTIRRHPWWISFITLGLTLTSAVAIAMIPDRYQAMTTVLVDPQRVPEDSAPNARSPLTERLRGITQEVLMSEPRLQDIITKYNLDPELRESTFPPFLRWLHRSPSNEEIVDAMRRRIELMVKQAGANAPVTVSITYQGLDPTGTAQVANELAKQLIEWNVKGRQQQTASAVDFLKEQLKHADKDIEEQERVMRDFKISHAGEMPSDLPVSLQTLAQLRTMYQANTDALNRLGQEYVELTRPGAAAASSNSKVGQPQTERERIQSEISQLKDKLMDLRRRYKPSYPEVVDAEARLQGLEQQFKGLPPDSEEAVAVSAVSPNAKRLEANRHSTERLNEEQKRLNAQIAGYQHRVDVVPLREQQFAELTRNYNILKQDYQTLFQKMSTAEMTANLEERQGADRFVVLNQARPPEHPYTPNRPLLLTGAFFVSLCTAVGLVVVKDVFRGTIMTEANLANLLPGSVTVLACIPKIASPRDTARKRRFAGFATAVLVAACLVAVVIIRRIHP